MDNKLQVVDNQAQVVSTANTLPAWPSAVAKIAVQAEQLQSEVLRIGTSSVSSLNAGTGSRINGLEIFETAIMMILEFYRTKWESSQIEETADLMHKDYHWLQLAEIRHFVERAKKGIFNVKRSVSRKSAITGALDTQTYDGKLYGPLTPAYLLIWICEYANESLTARAFVYGESMPPPKSEDPKAKYVSPEQMKEAMRAFEEMTQKARKPPADAHSEMIYQKAKARSAAVRSFAERQFRGDDMSSPTDQSFYESNRSAIDPLIAELKTLFPGKKPLS